MPDKPPIKTENDADSEFQRIAAVVLRKIRASLSKKQRLLKNLRNDLIKHGDPETWKRYGDLLLANAGNAARKDGRVLVTDYFDEAAPVIEIEGDDNKSVTEIAEGYFRQYGKARNGQRIINERIGKTESDLAESERLLRQIETAIEGEDVEFLTSLSEPKQKPKPLSKKKKHEASFKGARLFVSSDGFEILVGKKAADNDYLTFRIARSLEIWMHAADYAGSHVVIRNPNRKEVSSRTLLEAAQLAAFYSSGRKQTKAAVNYTQKKFVNKPKRSLPGLVSLANFKTILVEPKIGDVTRS